MANEAMESARLLAATVWSASVLAASSLAPSALWAFSMLALCGLCAFPKTLLALKPASWPRSESSWGGFEERQWAPMALFMSAPWALCASWGCERLAWLGLGGIKALALWMGSGALCGAAVWAAARRFDLIWRFWLALGVWRDPGRLWILACEEPARARLFWMRAASALKIQAPRDRTLRFEVCWRLSLWDCAKGLAWARDAGFDVDQAGRWGVSRWRRPALAACQSGSERALRWLLSNGAALRHPLDSACLVCVSAMDGSLGCLRACLESGGDPNASQGGKSALEWALYCGSAHCAWALFDAGASAGERVDQTRAELQARGQAGEAALACLTAMRERVELEALFEAQKTPMGRLRRASARI